MASSTRAGKSLDVCEPPRTASFILLDGSMLRTLWPWDDKQMSTMPRRDSPRYRAELSLTSKRFPSMRCSKASTKPLRW